MTLNLNITERHNYVYIIYLSSIGKKAESTYKIGNTCDVLHIFRVYPKNSTLLFLCRVKDRRHVKAEMYIVFKTYFEQQTKYGSEYFSGDIKTMISYTNQIIDHMNQRVNEELMDKILDTYKNYLRFELCEIENIPDDFSDKLQKYYQNDQTNYSVKKKLSDTM